MKKMGKVIELERFRTAVDDNIDDSKLMFPQKLKEAKEMLEKYPIPAKIRMGSFSKREQEKGFEVIGVLKNANMENNTFLLLQKGDLNEIEIKIITTPQILNQLVKTHFGKMITVQIRPQINNANQFEYELMTVKNE